MKNDFFERCKQYFGKDADKFIDLLNCPCSQGFFLNTNKADINKILELIDFNYYKSDLTSSSFYHYEDNIGKTKVYELGLIYPQEIAASISSKVVDVNNLHTIVDMCAAPGGKTINILNRVGKDCLCISNEINYTRALTLSSNLERLGLDNVIVCNKQTDKLASQLENFADLVILDAPCSGEGMIRKYPEILDDYSINNIISLSKIQEQLLEDAYKMLKGNGQLLYSTCTYAFEEDENQIINFLNKHNDIELVKLENNCSSSLKGTIKLSPLNNTEGQFICLMKKIGNNNKTVKKLKSIKEKIVDKFINDNLKIESYYLYKHNNHYYISFIEMPDLGNNILKYGTYIGDVKNNRFEPAHSLYRSNSLIGKFNYVYDLNDDEYDLFVKGNELKVNLDNHYYLLTHHNVSVGFGKCSNNQLKNKYPKGLRKK